MKKKSCVPAGIVFGVLCLLAATAAGLGFIHLTGLPYRIDVDALGIPASSGYAREVALRNYGAVMEFLRPFSTAEFSLPDLAFSRTGAIHFEECRVLFNGVYAAGAAALALLVAMAAVMRGRPRGYLRVGGFVTLAVPCALLAAAAADFDSAFVLFHKLFFRNDYWYFDPATDPVIKILPERFFLHCALVIALFWALAAALELLAGCRRHTAE
ncbi:MAG: TIGR01906 family membrane protein [Oscillospiraceae bacterium]|nr:TIGR01906 family membrane protein [Oscillospiraceae bacterium]